MILVILNRIVKTNHFFFMATFTLESVSSALFSFFCDSQESPDNKKRAHEFLTEFQKHGSAWPISVALLNTPRIAMESYFFAAQTLHGKIILDFSTLGVEERAGLRREVFEAVERFAAAESPLRVQLALGLCALIVQEKEWKSPVKEVMVRLAKNETALMLLDVLCELPEECKSERYELSVQQEAAVVDRVAVGASDILPLLCQYLEASGDNYGLQNRVFRCVHRWASFRALTSEELSKSPLLARTFDALQNPKLFESAAASICKFLQSCGDDTIQSPLSQYLLSKVASLKPFLENALQQNDLIVGDALTRIFSDAGESFPLFILAGSNEALLILNLIVQCSRFSQKVCFDLFFV